MRKSSKIYQLKLKENTATWEQKDEDVHWGFRPENRLWAGMCAVNGIKKQNRVLADHFLTIFTG